MHLLHRNRDFLTIPEQHGGFRGEVHQPFQSVGRFALGVCLQHFSHGNQCQNHSGGFKVELVHIAHYCVHVALDLGICHGKQGVGTVYECRTGTQCHQCVHIRGTVEQALESADEEFPVDDHDDNGKQHLYQSHCHMVAVEERGQGKSPHHVSHRDIHEHCQKSHRGDQSPLQHRCFAVGEGIAVRSRRFVRTGLAGSTITGFLDGIDNCFGRSCALDSHGVGQQADRAAGDTVHLGNGFFHTGTARGTAHARNIVLFH